VLVMLGLHILIPEDQFSYSFTSELGKGAVTVSFKFHDQTEPTIKITSGCKREQVHCSKAPCTFMQTSS